MDILAARKKAAALAEARKAAEQKAAVEPPAQAPTPEAAPVKEAGGQVAIEAAGALAPVEQAPEVPAPAEPADGQAEAHPDQEPAAQEIEMLSFRLGDEEYALLVDDVKEVLKNRDLTEVPNAPDYILGVTALRGPILPVIDLCKRLGIPSRPRDEKSRIVVVTSGEEDVGVAVDRVTGVVRILPDAIKPVPETVQHGAEFLKGIARKNDRLYILLDRDKALGT